MALLDSCRIVFDDVYVRVWDESDIGSLGMAAATKTCPTINLSLLLTSLYVSGCKGEAGISANLDSISMPRFHDD